MSARAVDSVPKRPPRPRVPRPAILLAWLFAERRFLRWCRRRYGNVFLLPVSTRNIGPFVVVADPSEAKSIFTGDARTFHAGEANAGPLGPVMGAYSLLTLDEDEHLGRRKLMLPPFHGERMRVYGDVMREIADTQIDRWPLNAPFAVHPSMQEATLRVIIRTVFGIEETGRIQELERLLRGLTSTAARVLLFAPWLERGIGTRLPAWRRFLAMREETDRFLFDEIARRRVNAGTAERADVLSLLVEAHDEHGESMSDLELRDQLMTLLVAGYETTATALAWTLERVLRHPKVVERLRADLAAGSDDYLDRVIKESLRTRTVVSFAMRRLTAPVEVAGYVAAAGSVLATSLRLIHSDPGLYPEPEAFRPERFEDGRSESYAWLPFGGGVRRCLGAAFAMFEMKVVLKRIFERCELEAVGSPERERRRVVTLVPHRGGRVVMRSRRGAPVESRLATVA